jgi:hypothetical protein
MEGKSPRRSIVEHFDGLHDPRVVGRSDHLLLDILVIAICAVICGAEGWVSVEQFGRAKESWLRTFLRLPRGIPSHDTFGRVFAALNPEELSHCFASWVAALSEASAGEVIAIDGKTLRRSFDLASGKSAIHMVSAWASEARLGHGSSFRALCSVSPFRLGSSLGTWARGNPVSCSHLVSPLARQKQWERSKLRIDLHLRLPTSDFRLPISEPDFRFRRTDRQSENGKRKSEVGERSTEIGEQPPPGVSARHDD